MESKILKILINKCLRYKKNGEVPVAALILDKNNKIIALKVNNRQKKYNILGHAEILCIQKTAKKQKDWRLDGYKMYVTLEPCNMCREIIKESRLSTVYYLLERNSSKMSKNDEKIKQLTGYDEYKKSYSQILKSFFNNMR